MEVVFKFDSHNLDLVGGLIFAKEPFVLTKHNASCKLSSLKEIGFVVVFDHIPFVISYAMFKVVITLILFPKDE